MSTVYLTEGAEASAMAAILEVKVSSSLIIYFLYPKLSCFISLPEYISRKNQFIEKRSSI